MKIQVSLNEHDLKNLVTKHLEDLVDRPIEPSNIKVLVKSKQNFKSEWEEAEFKVELLILS